MAVEIINLTLLEMIAKKDVRYVKVNEQTILLKDGKNRIILKPSDIDEFAKVLGCTYVGI